ncbi:MAG: hypothetical protein VX438_14090 [Planctomycetota bacterium]|nr:hypothetical protein [Planctomycetota bacterium]
MSFLHRLVLSFTVTILWPDFGLTKEDLSEDRFRQLHQQLQPAADELWRTIPWKTSLLESQQLAIKEGKPIFIWAMDGHPLGCT